MESKQKDPGGGNSPPDDVVEVVRGDFATPEFLAARRRVLGDDKPATVLNAIISDDPRMNDVWAFSVRDPKRWLVSALDEHGTPRVYGLGDTQEAALKKAQLGAAEYREEKLHYRQMALLTEWTFIPYPPGD